MRKVYWTMLVLAALIGALSLINGCGKSDGTGVGGKIIITGAGA